MLTVGRNLRPHNQKLRLRAVSDFTMSKKEIRELTNPMTDAEAIWAFAAQDGSEILVQGMIFHAEANTLRHQVKLRGLCAEKQYRLDGTEQVYTGAALMAGGVLLPKAWGDYTPVSMHFTEV